MPLTDQDIRGLTYLADRCRPNGAPQWDEQGTFAAIAKVRHLAIADVAMSVIRASSDRNAKTPGVIANLGSPNWREKPAETSAAAYEPYDLGKVCGICDRSESRCRSNPHSGHGFVPKYQVLRSRTESTLARPARPTRLPAEEDRS